jgi:hypothetical protein
MNKVKAVSAAVFATSFIVSAALYQVVHYTSSHDEDELRVSMYVPSLDMQPLFSRQLQDNNTD